MFSWVLRKAYQKGLVDRESFVAQYLALAVFTTGIASALGADDLLAAFAAGSAISWDGHFNTRTEGQLFSSVIDFIINCACFIYIGAWLDFSAFHPSVPGLLGAEEGLLRVNLELGRLFVLLIGIFALRRIPIAMVLYRWVPEIDGWKEALFAGHFGPMGVGALFVSTLALTRLPPPPESGPPTTQQELLASVLHPIVSFVVLGSIVVHGFSITFFSFGKKASRRIAWYKDHKRRQSSPDSLSASTSKDEEPEPAINGGLAEGLNRPSFHSTSDSLDSGLPTAAVVMRSTNGVTPTIPAVTPNGGIEMNRMGRPGAGVRSEESRVSASSCHHRVGQCSLADGG